MEFEDEDRVLFEWYNINFTVPIDADDVRDRLPVAAAQNKETEGLYKE
jgi:hypothetical protein